MGPVVSPLRDMGCVDGQPGRFDDVFAVYAWVGTAGERTRTEHAGGEDCIEALESLPRRVDPAQLDSARGNEDLHQRYAKIALDWYYSALVARRCVEDPR